MENDRLKHKNKHRKLELEEQREKNRHEEQMAKYESDRYEVKVSFLINTQNKITNTDMFFKTLTRTESL